MYTVPKLETGPEAYSHKRKYVEAKIIYQSITLIIAKEPDLGGSARNHTDLLVESCLFDDGGHAAVCLRLHADRAGRHDTYQHARHASGGELARWPSMVS